MLNQQKRLELLDRVIRLEEAEHSSREADYSPRRGQEQLQEGQKALIREMNRRFTEMREDSDKHFREMHEDTGRRFKFVQWLIVAVGGFLGLAMTLLRFF